MGARITAEEAEQVMRAAGYEPLEPYPGWTVPWLFRCTACGTEGRTRAHGVRQRHGGCKVCGRERTEGARRLDGDVVAEKMRARGLEPLEPYPGAAKPWRVRCMTCGDESTPKWAKVQNRGDGCKTCGRKRAADAKRINPDTAAAFVREIGYEPLEPFTESKAAWPMVHVACGRVVAPKWDNLKAGQGGCTDCGREKSADARRIDAEEAETTMKAHQLEPLEPYRGRKHPWRCRCLRCGEETSTTMETVLAGNLGCIPCGRDKRGRLRRLPEAEAVALMNRVGLTPTAPYPGRVKMWAATCDECGDKTSIQLSSVLVRLGKSDTDPVLGCEACAATSMGERRRLTHQEAEARLLAAGMRPLEPYRGINEKWHAVCLTCGTEAYINTAHTLSRGRGCRPCGIKSRSDAQRKPEDEAVAVMLKAGFRPLETYRGTNKPWLCIHDVCGQETSPSLTAILSEKSGCAVCGGRKIIPGHNDLATTHTLLAREMAVDKGYDPTTYGAGSGRKALWRCDQGHEWKAIIGSRTGTGTGCPVCANKGFNLTEPAWLYLMRHDVWDMLQIGITNDPQVRMATHARRGWELMDIRGPMDGTLAQDWERAIVRMLRSSGVEMTPSGVVDQPGRTGVVRAKGEAWWRDDYSAERVRELMDAVETLESTSTGAARRRVARPTPPR